MARSFKSVPAGIYSSYTPASFRFTKQRDNRAQRRADRQAIRKDGIDADLGACVRRKTCHSYFWGERGWYAGQVEAADLRK